VQIVGGEISRRLAEVKGTLSKEVLGNCPAAIVLGGPDDGKAFILKTDIVAIGRTDPDNQTSFDPGKDIVLADGYTAVTRVSKPHGRFRHENGIWYIEDCGSTGGTQLNNKKVEDRARVPVRDGDLIELAKGISGVKLVLIIPPGAGPG
jgi:pSer/pThr/pTyr-binding forkhead associated (FHA) protein